MIPIDWGFGQAFTDGTVVRFYVGTKTYGDLWAIVDIADWPLISDRKWRATKRKNLFYVRGWKGGLIMLHRFLTEAPNDLVVDHRDGDGLNDRRANIRVCTQSDNAIFGADRRRGYERRVIRLTVPTKPHVVTMILADGSTKRYTYPTRAKSGTKTVVKVKRGQSVKTPLEDAS